MLLGASGRDDKKLFEHFPSQTNSSSMRRATTGREIEIVKPTTSEINAPHLGQAGIDSIWLHLQVVRFA